MLLKFVTNIQLAFIVLSLSSTKIIGQNNFQLFFTSPEGKQILPTQLFLADSLGGTITYTVQKNGILPAKPVFSLKALFDDELIYKQQFNPAICCTKYQFQAEPINILMGAVVIDINKEEARLQNATVSTSQLKSYLIDHKITTNLSQIVAQVPGVTYTDNQINIRNGSGWSYGAGSRTLIAVDEIPLLSGDANSALWSFLPIEITQNVDFIKNAGSVLFGSSALNGIMNVKTIKPGTTEQAKVVSNFGIYAQPSNEQYRIFAKPHSTQNINGYYSPGKAVNQWLVHWNINNDNGYRLFEFDRRARLGFKYNHISKIKGLQYGSNQSFQYGKSGSFLLWESNAKPYQSLDSGYNFNYNTRISVEPYVLFTKTKTSHKVLTRLLYTKNQIEDDNPNTNNSNGSTLGYIEYKLKNYINKRINLYSGAVAMFALTNSPLYTQAQNTRNIALYSQIDYKTKKLILNAGARYESFKMGTTQTSKPVFRFGSNYKLARATLLRASIGQGFRFPSVAEAFTQTSVSSIAIYANPQLQPETSIASEIGIKQGLVHGNLSAYIDIAAYRNVLTNMMEFTFAQWEQIPVPPSSGFGFKSVNVGKGLVQGIETELAAQYKTKKQLWRLLAGHTYSHTQNLEPNKIFAYDQSVNQTGLTFLNTRSDTSLFMKYRYKHLFKLDLETQIKKIMIGISSRYNSRMLNIDNAFQTFPIAIFVPGIAQTRNLMGNVWIWDLRAGYTLSPHWDVNMQIQNLVNTFWIGRPADVQPPRLAQIQLKYTY